MPIWLGIGLSLLVAGLAYLLRALTVSGAAAASVVGTVILATTGWDGATVLGGYFFLASAVGRITSPLGPQGADAKGETRDHWQVLANGGFAAVGSLAELAVPDLGYWLVTVILCAAAADTVATGVGGLSPRPPRDILRWGRVDRGASGGVTLFGSSAGVAAAALVSLVGAGMRPELARQLYPAAIAIGLFGMLADSVLGASVQARFHCPSCGRDTERRVHRCGTASEHRGGWRWLDNDGVNALSTGLAGGLGLLWWLSLSR
ncbi:MAG: DUF92 domain-containing protein [Gemmatimonadales bacterium]